MTTRNPPPQKPAVAVALRYNRAEADAPQVVASGRGATAERILQLAFEHGVKVREDADLAELLAAVEVGNQIPIAAFAAVAEILVYIYRANRTQPPPHARGATP
ncbi:MAG: EscU/YscU/HrcU family type III secretion system export apparatus switch protein [Stellaceae bacterium]